MSDLVRFYKNYYRNQDLKSLNSLFNALVNYDFESYNDDLLKIFKLWIDVSCCFDFLEMKSNGSTAPSNPYLFGPHPYEWLQKIERYLRLRQNKTIFVYTQGFGNKYSPNFHTTKIQNSPQRDLNVFGNYAIAEHMNKLLAYLDNCCGEFKKINILSHPHIWTFLTTNAEFRDWTERNSAKIGAFVNTDWDASFKSIGVYCRDQMIDWKSGVNFYTCQDGFKHFLPIFFCDGNYFYNLLNLSHFKSNIDDLVNIKKEPLKCSCGKIRLNFEIIPHYKHRVLNNNNQIINISCIYNDLECNYQNLQIFQDAKNNISVLYATKSEKISSDLFKIKSFLNANNLEKITFEQSKYFQIGRKRYSIWKDDFVSLKDFFVN